MWRGTSQIRPERAEPNAQEIEAIEQGAIRGVGQVIGLLSSYLTNLSVFDHEIWHWSSPLFHGIKHRIVVHNAAAEFVAINLGPVDASIFNATGFLVGDAEIVAANEKEIVVDLMTVQG